MSCIPVISKRLEAALPTLLVFFYYSFFLSRWQLLPNDYKSLDGAWRTVLSHFAFEPVHFGQDLIYTMGPLGFLRQPIHYPGLYVYHVLWGFLLVGVFTLVFARLFQNGSRLERLGYLLLFLLLPILAQYWYEHILFLVEVFFLFLTVSNKSPRLSFWQVYFPFVLAIIALIHFTHLVSATVLVMFVAALHYAKFRKVSLAPLFFIGFWVAGWLMLKQPLAGIGPYLKHCWFIASGYVDVMARYGAWWHVVAVLIAFLVFLFSVLIHRDRNQPWITVLLVLALCVVFFFAFKSSVVRHSTGRMRLTALTLTGMAMAHLVYIRELARSHERSRWIAIGCLALCLVISVSFADANLREAIPQLVKKTSRRFSEQVQGISRLLDGNKALQVANRKQIEKIQAEFELPLIDGPVDLFGHQQGILIAYDMDYRPRPVFQTFMAYTPELAELNAKFYRGASAPPTIVVAPYRFGGYYPTFFDARVFLELLQSYRLAGRVEKQGWPILVRKEREPFDFDLLKEASYELGEVVSLQDYAPEKTLIWVEIDIPETLLGKLTATAFKLPFLWMEVHFANGRKQRFRFAAQPARGGFLLSPRISVPSHVEHFMRGGMPSVPPGWIVESFRVYEHDPEWSSWFREDLKVRAHKREVLSRSLRASDDRGGALPIRWLLSHLLRRSCFPRTLTELPPRRSRRKAGMADPCTKRKRAFRLRFAEGGVL